MRGHLLIVQHSPPTSSRRHRGHLDGAAAVEIAPCGGTMRCVSGWITTGTLQAIIDASGAPGFGSHSVLLAG
jgi:acyl dehydratase